MEKSRKALQVRLDKLNDQSRKDNVVTFEQLGVDRLFVDESHNYKNLFLYTKMRNVAGIAQTEAQKSSDMFAKCQYLDEITGGKGVTFATGTPISNSMTELYTNMRYLQYGTLQKLGLGHFDAWAASFGETQTAIELAPEGTGYRAKTRFAKFFNLPELIALFKESADIQTPDMLKLPVPEAEYENVVLKPSEFQKDMVASLAERAEAVRDRQVQPYEDNMLKITNDGRKLALDQRLLNDMLPDEENSKASTCVEKAYKIWENTKEQKSAQLIFCDLSTPKGDGTFNVYEDIKNKLMEKGVPENEIAFIHDANQDSREYGEYHLDVRYNTDTDELIDMKERKAVYDKAMEPINADDVVVKFASIFESEWEVLKITNMLRDDVGKMLKDMASLDEKEWDGNYLSYMEKQGAEITLLASSSKELNGNMPDFWDYEYDFDAGLTDAEELSVMQQAEHIINRLEHGQPAFSDDERNLIVNYAYKLGDMEKTRELAEHIYAQEVDGNQDVALAMIDAQAEIDALPDSMVGISEMQEYGYTWIEMLPLTQERALELFDHDLPVYLLHTDGSESTVADRKQILEHDGMCGIEKGDWQNERKLLMMQEELTESNSNREALLLYGNTDKYGIYQLKDNPELDKFRFEGTESLKRMGITKDNFDAVLPENYKLVYLGELSELQGRTQSETLEAIYKKLNIDHPADYKAHSLSVSDIVVLHENGENSAHFVDSFGFTELPKFMLTLEGKENEIETELAVHIADRYILMHECDEGYDYSILNEQYHLLDGGVYDNPDITIQRAMDMVIADLKEPRFSAVTEQYYRDEFLQGEVYAGSEAEIVDFEELSEKAEEVEQTDLEAKQAEFRENNPDVVADFRAKTEELFHSLDGQSADDIEKTVYAYVQSQIDEYGLDAKIVDVVVAGSRCRGIEQENSDLDVVVEYTGSSLSGERGQ